MYIYIYIYIYIVCVCICVYINIILRIYIYKQYYTYTHSQYYIYIYIYIYIHTHTHTILYKYIISYTYTHIVLYTYTHIISYTHSIIYIYNSSLPVISENTGDNKKIKKSNFPIELNMNIFLIVALRFPVYIQYFLNITTNPMSCLLAINKNYYNKRNQFAIYTRRLNALLSHLFIYLANLSFMILFYRIFLFQEFA